MSKTDANLSPVAALVRQYDRERFVTALLAPAQFREDLLVLYGFNAEVSRIRFLTREPLAAAIRLQWWREMVSGQRPAFELERHPVAAPLRRLIVEGLIEAALIDALLDARDWELGGEPFATLADLDSFVQSTAGGLGQSAAQILGATSEESLRAARLASVAYGLVGLLRSVRHYRSLSWVPIPLDLLADASIDWADAVGRGDLSGIARLLGEVAAGHLATARRIKTPRAHLAASLTGTLAGGHLKVLARHHWKLDDPAIAGLRPMPGTLMWRTVLGSI